MNYLRLDLKVCEGCGALWLRGGSMEGVYCKGCVRLLAHFPARREKNPGGRPRCTGRTTRRTATALAGGAR